MDIDKAVLNEQINRAIDSHQVWKFRLQKAIEEKASEYLVEDLGASNLCDFGKWLYLDVDQTLRKSGHYDKVRDLHQQFHQAAAAVLSLALSGKKDEANAAMGIGSEYARLSSELIIAMGQWRDEV